MGQGHIVDAYTLCHWTFDEALPDGNGETSPDHLGASTPLSMGTGSDGNAPGFTDFTPVPGLYARKWHATNSASGVVGPYAFNGTSAASQSFWIGSWSVEMYLRLDKIPASGSGLLDPIFGHVGSPTSNTEAENHLGLICVNEFGKIVVLWQYGASGLQETITQTAGSGPPVANPHNGGDLTNWCHLMVTKDSVANEVKILLNGVVQDTKIYVNEPTGGSGGSWRVGANGDGTAATSGHRVGSFAMRNLMSSNIVRDATWALANYALMTTTGTMNVDANTIGRSWRLAEAPSVIDHGPRKMHLVYAGPYSGGSPNANSLPVGSLIDDGGSARHLWQDGSLAGFYDQKVVDALTADFTFEGWFLVTLVDTIVGGGGPTTEVRGIFQQGDPSDDSTSLANYIAFEIRPTQTIRVDWERFNTNGTNSSLTAPSNTTKWATRYHLALRKSVSAGLADWAIFVNGVKVAEALATFNYGGSSTNLFSAWKFKLGAKASNGQPLLGGAFAGVMDDVILYSNARTDQQILADYDRGAGGSVYIPIEEL